jgi:hypothetical protein
MRGAAHPTPPGLGEGIVKLFQMTVKLPVFMSEATRHAAGLASYRGRV